MKTTTTQVPAAPAGNLADWPWGLAAQTFQQWTQAQAGPVNAWLDWLGTLAALQQEWLDEWAVHFGGGAPIDG